MFWIKANGGVVEVDATLILIVANTLDTLHKEMCLPLHKPTVKVSTLLPFPPFPIVSDFLSIHALLCFLQQACHWK